MNAKIIKQSKFLSLVLRHKPEKIGLILDKNGWADVKELFKKTDMNMITLERIVSTNNKKRFAFNDSRTKIRASQGHSIDIDLKLEAQEPPEILFHGTTTRSLARIYDDGLLPMSRQHVHLSTERDTASKVGQRHGRPSILQVNSKKMYEDGYDFYLSDNGVWLTAKCPTKYLSAS